MTLTTHAVVGASVASLVPSRPVLGFALGFISHFLMDAIPHWDYKLNSSNNKGGRKSLEADLIIGRAFWGDFARVAFDAILGVLLSLLIITPITTATLIAAFAGAIGAQLPDALQFVYFKTRREPLRSLQRFHLWMHADHGIENKVWGPFLQIAIITAIAVVFSITS